MTAVGHELVGPIIADQCVGISGASGEANVIDKIIEPTGNITQ